MPGSRSYCFTINNPSVDEVNDLFQNDFKYMIIGFETGKKGTPHIQGYLQYYQPVTFNTVKLSLPTAHIEVAKGTPQQNIAYCSLDLEGWPCDIYTGRGRPSRSREQHDNTSSIFKDISRSKAD